MPYISGGSGSGKISGVTVTGSAVLGQVPVAASGSTGAWAYPPGFEIGYDQITAGVNVVSTTEATGTTIITCAAHTFDGAPVLVEFFSGFVVSPTPAGSTLTVSLFEAATQITELGWIRCGLTPAANAFALDCKFRFTPTAAPHTYTITAFVSSTTGTPAIGAGAGGTGATPPCFVRFTKV